ncbi:hypothetical protein P9X10_02250 [Bacillus cereus]|nr:hypothetical protein [Bacillus cereus]
MYKKRIESAKKHGIIVMGTGARRLNLDLMKESIKIMKQEAQKPDSLFSERNGYLQHNVPTKLMQ